jgi:bacterioferritin (cytochrome b1)
MKSAGMRISDGDNILSVKLSDILDEVSNADSFHWDILFLDGMPNPGNPGLISECEHKINKSKNGLLVSLNELKATSNKFCSKL